MSTQPHIRFGLMGSIDGVQGWSLGLSFITTATDVVGADLSNWLTSIQTAVQTWATDATGGFATLNKAGCQISAVRAAFYPPSSLVASATADMNMGPWAGQGTPEWPSQCALVVSLYAPVTGRRNRGRAYIPVTAGQPLTKNLLQQSYATSVATSFKTFAGALEAQNLAGQGLSWAIAVPGNYQAQTVTKVAVDTLIDTQRRRTDKYVSNASYLPYP